MCVNVYVCVCFCHVKPHGAFYQCCFSIRPTEQEAVAQNHFVPHKKVFNGIRWGKKSQGMCRQMKTAHTRAHTQILPQTAVPTLDFPRTLFFFSLTDTRYYVSADIHALHTHTHTHALIHSPDIAPQLLVCGAPSGTPLHRNVSAAGSWEKGV